jgi:hypothetical protein
MISSDFQSYLFQWSKYAGKIKIFALKGGILYYSINLLPELVHPSSKNVFNYKRKS